MMNRAPHVDAIGYIGAPGAVGPRPYAASVPWLSGDLEMRNAIVRGGREAVKGPSIPLLNVV
jgi:hypothetical protein